MMRNSVGYKKLLEKKHVSAIQTLASSGKPVSARAIQRIIGGQRVDQKELEVLIKKLAEKEGLKVKRGNVRVQPANEIKAEAKKKLIRNFIIHQALNKDPVSPRQVMLRFGGRREVVTRLFEEIVSDQKLIDFLAKKGVAIIRAKAGGQAIKP